MRILRRWNELLLTIAFKLRKTEAEQRRNGSRPIVQVPAASRASSRQNGVAFVCTATSQWSHRQRRLPWLCKANVAPLGFSTRALGSSAQVSGTSCWPKTRTEPSRLPRSSPRRVETWTQERLTLQQQGRRKRR